MAKVKLDKLGIDSIHCDVSLVGHIAGSEICLTSLVNSLIFAARSKLIVGKGALFS
jgi:hypothetical protein